MNSYMLLVVSMVLNFYGQDTEIDLRTMNIRSPNREEGLFLGRGMGGVVITFSYGHPGSDLRQYISHLNGSQGSVKALVPALGTGPFNRLLDVVSGEDPVDDRDASLQTNHSDPF